MLLYNFGLLLFYCFLLIHGCISQSIDDEIDSTGGEGSGNSWNPDDEGDAVEGSGSSSGLPHKVHENRTNLMKNDTSSAKASQESDPSIKHPDSSNSASRNSASSTGIKKNELPESAKNDTANIGGLKPKKVNGKGDSNAKKDHAKVAASRSTWILIVTVAVIVCILIALVIFIMTKRSSNSKRGGDGYTAGSRVSR